MEQLTTARLVLAPDAPIDLQLHITYSDGEWTPEQLIDYLIHEQFGLVAITDHERVDTVPALQQLAFQKGLPILVAADRPEHKPIKYRAELSRLLLERVSIQVK